MTNTALIADLKKRLVAWSEGVVKDIDSAGVFLFGSLVYRGGAQFGAGSDVDLVVLFPNKPMDALARRGWLEKLLEHKIRLEAELATVLTEADPEKPLCSIVVSTSHEVMGDIHKDGARGFFKENAYLSLLDGKEFKGLPGAGTREIKDRLAIEGLRFTQKKRNTFLAVNAKGEGGIKPYAGDDPAPKDIMRHAAMAAHSDDRHADPGAEYDTQEGLDFLTHELYRRRGDAPAYRDLHHWLSVRRGARGDVGPLKANDHLLFAEIIADAACARLNKSDERLPSLREHSTVWFSGRFAQAFPGVRGVQWFKDPEQVKTRLLKLLEPPIEYADAQPVWWFRGPSNLPIRAFEHLRDRLYQMDENELLIRRIAAVKPGPYYCDFMYVELDPMEPIGIYSQTAERIVEEMSGEGHFGYYWEEYGLVDGKHVINRSQYDDGVAEIGGKIEDVRGRTQLRVRYVTAYNFIIAASHSSINNGDFDKYLEEVMSRMLHGEDLLQELGKAVLRLPKRH
ncbi:nucleotidyltransferase domain-containing protein [Bradyrhizobium sp. IC3069]|uniref:nucleotidyltransferase domain-containing protein n=1 Tax=unclassified Bradyrhizobium TaxID=2631580 RepID=UPI001CD23245|nr:MULTISPECIES: nucleotidyltransferase domain-containing protein [unclassified Bradyrhizobium]MCA1363417.1 nucleotidyltransferase domain-containing protein [Bradyrhizobium sp. IC4059]MCA1520955.1 nucleotidyltransferase domain-containing protein [Bradyrhizobium sp. IC3069]